jgi:hypothetical protein
MNTFQKHNNAAEASTREQLQSHPQSYVVNVVESDADKKNANKTTTTNKKKKSVSFGTLVEVKYVLDYRNIMTKQAKDAYWYNSQDYKVFQNDYEYVVKRYRERIQKECAYHYAKKIAEPQAKKEQKKNKKIIYNDHNNNNNVHPNSMVNKSTTTNKKKKKSVSFGTLEVKYVLDYRNIMTKQAKDAYWYNSQDYKVFQNNYEYKVERDHERIQKERVHHYAKKIAEPQAKKEQKKNKKIKYNHHNNNNNTHTNSMGAFTRSFASRMTIIKNGRNEPNNSSERLCPPLLRKFVRKGISKQPHSNDNNKNADFDIVIDPVASHKALTELEAFLKKNKSTRRLV